LEPIVIILSLLAGVLPFLVSAGSVDSLPRIDSSSVVSRIPDSTTRSTAPVIQTAPVSNWSSDFALGVGVVAVDFPERARFSTELSNDAASYKWTLDQPFSGSDLGPRIEWEGALRRKDRFRLAIGAWWEGWSAQGIARDSTGALTYRSYGSDILVASVGADLLISRSFLRLDAGQDAYIGARWLIGTGRLEGRQTIWGLADGVSIKAGAEFLRWTRGAIEAHLAVDWLGLTSNHAWSEVLWSSAVPDKVSWAAGGLSLGVQLRWGAPRDTLPKLPQKK
jgi:hypothetical protein